VNSASPAVRDPYSTSWFDYDLAVGISFPGAFTNTDFDNHGDNASLPANHASAGDFLDLSLGGQFQFGAFGVSATGDLQQFQVSAAGTSSLTMQIGRWKALAAYGLLGGQVVVGGGLRIVTMQMNQSGAGTLLTMTGLGPEVGALVMPTGHRWRLGASARAPVSGGAFGSENVTTVGGLREVAGQVLPDGLTQPWEVEAGVAFQLGPRPINPGWENPHDEEAELREEIERDRGKRALRDATDLALAPSGEREKLRAQQAEAEKAVRAIEDEHLSEESARLQSIRKARYQNWPREKILLLASVLMTGPSANAISLEGFLDQQVESVGQNVSFTPRLGLEGEPLNAEVLWQDTRTRDGLIAQLAEALGLDNPDSSDPGLLTWQTSELTVRVHLEEAGDLAARLDFPGPKPRKKHLRQAIGQRRRQASGHLASSQPADLTIIEIGHPDDFAPLTDPKFTLRLGCADAGRLTQFITTPSGKKKTATRTSIEHRSLQSWTDGFRQLGLSTIPEHSLDGLPAGLNTVALWLVKRRADGPTGQRRMTPVAVRTDPSGAITGWDPDTGEWIPYRTMLLRLTRNADIPGEEEAEAAENEESGKSPRPWYPDFEEQRAITAQFIKPLLYSLRREEVLLITHAQNTRGLWPFLVNGNLLRDSLQFGASPAQGIGLYGDGLRHVRVRDHSMNETPQWYGCTPAAEKVSQDDDPTDHYGIAAGLWVNPDGGSDLRTFLSTAAKASTAKNAAVDASKFTTRANQQGETVIDTGKNASNPGIIELAVAACNPAPGAKTTTASDPELWAALVHQLRRAPDYRDTLALPLQMHLAKLTEEYVLPHDPDA